MKNVAVQEGDLHTDWFLSICTFAQTLYRISWSTFGQTSRSDNVILIFLRFMHALFTAHGR